MASVIHQTAIKTTMQAVAIAGPGISVWVIKPQPNKTENNGPSQRP
jgi:hypothetical protein